MMSLTEILLAMIAIVVTAIEIIALYGICLLQKDKEKERRNGIR